MNGKSLQICNRYYKIKVSNDICGISAPERKLVIVAKEKGQDMYRVKIRHNDGSLH